MTSEPWPVEFERRADKDLERLDAQVRQRVFAAIERLASDPHGAALRKLTGRPLGAWVTMRETAVFALVSRSRSHGALSRMAAGGLWGASLVETRYY